MQEATAGWNCITSEGLAAPSLSPAQEHISPEATAPATLPANCLYHLQSKAYIGPSRTNVTTCLSWTDFRQHQLVKSIESQTPFMGIARQAAAVSFKSV